MRFFFNSLILVGFVQLLGADSLKLSEAYVKALLIEGRVKGYEYQVQASKESSIQAKSKLFPTLSASAKVGWRKYDPRYADDIRNETSNTFSAELVQPLYHPEHLSELDKSEVLFEVSELKYKKEKFLLGKEVAKAYFEVKRSEKNVELSISYTEANKAKYEQIKRTHSFGINSKVDLLEAKVNFDMARIEFIREKKHLDVSLISLSRIIGEDVKLLTATNIDPWSIEKIFTYDYEYWHKRLGNNVDYLLSKANVNVSKKDLKTRKYGHYPKVDAKLSYVQTNSTDLYTYRSDTRADVEVNIPIFQGWYVESRIEEGKLLLQAANQEVAYNHRITDLIFEEEWEKYSAAFESVKVLREAVESAELYMLSIEKSYIKGLKSLFDYYDAKARLFQVQRDLVDAMFDIAISYTGLLEVTGELTIERFEELDVMLAKAE